MLGHFEIVESFAYYGYVYENLSNTILNLYGNSVDVLR